MNHGLGCVPISGVPLDVLVFVTPFLRFLTGKNKRVGKQLASQKILQLLHPHVKNWGSLLRMYGRESSKMVKQVAGALPSQSQAAVLLSVAASWALWGHCAVPDDACLWRGLGAGRVGGLPGRRCVLSSLGLEGV